MGKRTLPVDYTKRETPPDYKCDKCGATGCKLWREYQTFADSTLLLCCDCAAKDQGKDISDIDERGKHGSKYGRSDQIGCYIPAVPTEEDDTFWGYTSVPQAGCDWWYGLPTRAGGPSARIKKKDKPSKRKSGTDKHKPRIHVEPGVSDGITGALQRVADDDGTERDWRNGITVPRPRMWDERPDLIGQTVVPHTCHAKMHGDNDGCICEFIGKRVVIECIYETPFVGTPSYHIKGSKKRVQEREFSDETKGKEPDVVEGYILEGPDGKFLTAGFVWLPAKTALDGYLHNTQVVRDLLEADFPSGRPVRAHPAKSRLDGGGKQITGEPILFDRLTP